MTRLAALVLASTLAGCTPGSSEESPETPASAQPGGGAETATGGGGATEAPAAGPSGEVVVVARVLDSGPIGDGPCVQCSHEVQVEEQLSGDLGTGTDPVWVHYESCAADPAPEPPAGAIDPCGMHQGSRYELHLRRGTSDNFGNDPMIQVARPR